MSKTILTITGPSLSGKTTMGRWLKASGHFIEAVSHTTRYPRAAENHGEDYYFVTHEEFDKTPMIGMTRVNLKSYGTSIAELERCLETNQVPFAVVDPTGAKYWRQFALERELRHVAIWVDINREDQILRWMDRVKADSKDNIDQHLDRLYAIMLIEDEWYEEFPWDFEFAEFNQDTESTVLEQLALICGLRQESHPEFWSKVL